MTIDNYTKFIMTVIAGALVVIAFKGIGLIPTATAQSSVVQKIAICSPSGNSCVGIVGNGMGLRVN